MRSDRISVPDLKEDSHIAEYGWKYTEQTDEL